MRLVFVSNYINHHQMPVSQELNRLCREQGGSYAFVQTEPMEQERVDMGWGESLDVLHPNTHWCNIAGKASDMHAEESLEVKLPNTDRCNIAGAASDMHVEESLDVLHPNADQCNTAGAASGMHVEGSLEVKLPNTDWRNIAGRPAICGDEESRTEAGFVRNYWEDEKGCQRMIEEADAVIFGGCEDEKYIEARLEAGKPVWRYSEPLYKTGRYKFVSPRGLRKKYHDHTRYRKRRVYLLCAGAYVAGDFRLVGAYGGKRFRYGYFPAFRQHDMERLMAGKDQASQGRLRLLWAARMIDWKHPETALQVAAGLQDQGMDFELVMIGDGVLRQEMQERVKTLGLERQVSFPGYCNPEETRAYMEKAHIFLATSDRQEGWGAVVNEAMNSGCALIAGKGMGAAPYLVRQGENGYLYDHKNPRQAVELARKLAGNAALRKRMGSAAYETVRTLWNPRIAAQRLYACIAAEIAGQELPEYKEGPLSRDLICL